MSKYDVNPRNLNAQESRHAKAPPSLKRRELKLRNWKRFSERGWTAEVKPENHAVSKFQFDVIIGTDGRRHTLKGFKRKEFRGKLAIAVTMNFVNRNTKADARVEEISGVAFIFNQGFFQDLKEATGIDLENIVYYKDETHYFVMTAKKKSLLLKGVLKKVVEF